MTSEHPVKLMLPLSGRCNNQFLILPIIAMADTLTSCRISFSSGSGALIISLILKLKVININLRVNFTSGSISSKKAHSWMDTSSKKKKIAPGLNQHHSIWPKFYKSIGGKDKLEKVLSVLGHSL